MSGAEPGSKSPTSPGRSPGAQSGDGEEQNATIEVDVVTADDGDGYSTESEGTFASTSISSTVRDFVFENNRRYHKYREGAYLLPNDEPEQEREDMKHAMVLHVCDGYLHFAPLDNPQRILDIGTGTGIWAIDMADEYPSAEVMGIDLSPIQPAWIPPNLRFIVDDAESEWSHGPNKFDYVHARHVSMAIKNWPRLLEQAYEALKPGGWVELQDIRLAPLCDDGTMPEDYAFAKFIATLQEALSKFNVNLLGMERYQGLLRDAGFVNVEEKIWKIPIGSWAKDSKMKTTGAYNRAVMYDALQGASMGPYTRGLGWSPTEVEVFLVDVRKSLSNSSVHSYYTFHAVYGQKPT